MDDKCDPQLRRVANALGMVVQPQHTGTQVADLVLTKCHMLINPRCVPGDRIIISPDGVPFERCAGVVPGLVRLQHLAEGWHCYVQATEANGWRVG